ncbi:MAG: discoidin domain-containing protein [Spirulina sp. SIO3F2]|nr:discoidin domain-containing protein [Spirulina sp. SIO3F2]
MYLHFVFTFSRVVFSEISSWPKTRQYVLRDFFLYGFGMINYFVFYKLLLIPFLDYKFQLLGDRPGAVGSLYEASVSLDIVNQLNLFLSIFNVTISGSLFLLFRYASSKVILCLIVISIIYYLVSSIQSLHPLKSKKNRTYTWILQIFLTLVILPLVSLSPLLFSKGATSHQWFTFRSILPYSTIALLAVLKLIFFTISSNKAKYVKFYWSIVLAIIFPLVTGYATFSNLYRVVFNAHRSLNFVRGRIAASNISDVSTVRRIVTVALNEDAARGSFLKGLSLEFAGMPIQPTLSLVIKVLKENNIKTLEVHQIDPHIEDNSFEYTDSTQQYINFNDIAYSIDGKHLNLRRITTSSTREVKTLQRGDLGLNAVDEYVTTFWETNKKMPQWLQVELPKKEVLKAYSLRAFEKPNRMPKAWKVLGSNDGNSWSELSQIIDNSYWSINECRTYKVEDIHHKYRYYKFLFSSTHSPILRLSDLTIDLEDDSQLCQFNDFTKSIRPDFVDRNPILIEEDYRGFNIIQFKRQFYAILQSDGEFKINKFESGDYSPSFKASGVIPLKKEIDNNIPLEQPVKVTEPILIEEGYRGFNIIQFKDRFYAILQADGEFKINKFKSDAYLQAIEASTADLIKEEINLALLGDLANVTYPILVEKSFNGFSLFIYKNKYYAIPKVEDRFDFSKLRNGEYSRFFFAPDHESLKSKIENFCDHNTLFIFLEKVKC